MSDALKRVLDAVAPRGDGLKKSGSGWSARCPAHEDRQASLSIGEGQDGRVLLKCHAGCDHKAILAALRLEERELFEADATRPAAATKPAGRAYATAGEARQSYERTLGEPTASWEYKLDGELVGVVLRWDRPDGKKEIRPLSFRAGRWRLEHMAAPRPLYGLGSWPMTVRDRVYVVEGEKCVDAARGLGLLAATSSGGSNAASKTDWSPLAGLDVVVLPDADDAGRKYADEVAAILHSLDPPATVRIVELDGLEPGGDVADLREACRDEDELQALRDRVKQLADDAEPLRTAAAPASSPSVSPIEAWRPFPTSTLPPAAATLVEEAARAIGCDEAFVALPLLAVLGAAIGTTRRVEIKPGWRALPIVWPVTVAESGSQKSPAADVSLDYVRDREDRLHDEYLSELSAFEIEAEDYEKARSAWRHSKKADERRPDKPGEPTRRRVLIEDATVEALVAALEENPRGLLVANDELSSWLGSMGRYNGSATADESFYLSTYGGRSRSVSRRKGSIHVRSAACWITGTIQPGVLQRALGVERRESGLLARLLLAHPPRRPKQWTTDSIGWATREDFVRVMEGLYGLRHELVDGRQESQVVRLSVAAEELFVAFYERHGRELIELTGDLAAAWSKLEETAGRLALIFHEARLAAGEGINSSEIDAVTMAAAIELVGWFKHETRRVYRLLAETAEDRATRQSGERLEVFVAGQGGTVAVRDVIAGVRSIEDAEQAEEALQRLVEAGRGRWIERRTTDKGGRPTRVFSLKAAGVSAQPPKTSAKTSCADADTRREAEPETQEYIEI